MSSPSPQPILPYPIGKNIHHATLVKQKVERNSSHQHQPHMPSNQHAPPPSAIHPSRRNISTPTAPLTSPPMTAHQAQIFQLQMQQLPSAHQHHQPWPPTTPTTAVTPSTISVATSSSTTTPAAATTTTNSNRQQPPPSSDWPQQQQQQQQPSTTAHYYLLPPYSAATSSPYRVRFGSRSPSSMEGSSSLHVSSTSERKKRKPMPHLGQFFSLKDYVTTSPHEELDLRLLPRHVRPHQDSVLMCGDGYSRGMGGQADWEDEIADRRRGNEFG